MALTTLVQALLSGAQCPICNVRAGPDPALTESYDFTTHFTTQVVAVEFRAGRGLGQGRISSLATESPSLLVKYYSWAFLFQPRRTLSSTESPKMALEQLGKWCGEGKVQRIGGDGNMRAMFSSHDLGWVRSLSRLSTRVTPTLNNPAS